MGTKSSGMPDGVKAAMFWSIGLGVIALSLVILLIIFGNLSGNLGFGQTSSAMTNETITLQQAGDTPATAANRVNGALSSIVMTNATGGEIIESGNYSISGVIITNLSGEYGDESVNVTGTVTYDSAGKVDTDNVILNYSLSAVNISEQFPTVGTIIGIALLLVVLIGLLAFAISRMVGVASSPTGGSGSFERGGFG